MEKGNVVILIVRHGDEVCRWEVGSDGWIDGWTDRLISGRKEGRMDGLTNGRKEGWMDE